LILFHNIDIDLSVKNKNFIKNWIKNSIINHYKKLGDINIIFCSDKYLLKINKQYLNHNYYTDVITFNYNNQNKINGDIFISIDTVKQNSITFNTNFDNEILRVIIHGILHLIGYNDKTKKEQKLMREKENELLSQINHTEILFHVKQNKN
jgi:rRNA maturation RNase YbeY